MDNKSGLEHNSNDTTMGKLGMFLVSTCKILGKRVWMVVPARKIMSKPKNVHQIEENDQHYHNQYHVRAKHLQKKINYIP